MARLAIAVRDAFTTDPDPSAARTFAGDRLTEAIAFAGNAAHRSGYIDVVARGAG